METTQETQTVEQEAQEALVVPTKRKRGERLLDVTSRLFQLVKRHMLRFLKNKTAMFFAFMTPVLVLLLYVLFLNNAIIGQVSLQIGDPYHLLVPRSMVMGITFGWLIGGILSIGTLTIALNSILQIVGDKEFNVMDDFTASPINPVFLQFSYFIAHFAINFLFCFAIMSLGLAFLAILGLQISFIGFLALTGILLLTSLSSVAFMLFAMSFFKTIAAGTAFNGLFTVTAGFATGAYLPAGMMAPWMQSVSSFVPAAHSTALFRRTLLQSTLNSLRVTVPYYRLEVLYSYYSFNLSISRVLIAPFVMYIAVAFSVFLFFGLFSLKQYLTTKHLYRTKKKKRA